MASQAFWLIYKAIGWAMTDRQLLEIATPRPISLSIFALEDREQVYAWIHRFFFSTFEVRVYIPEI